MSRGATLKRTKEKRMTDRGGKWKKDSQSCS